jgi:HAMP domain-containing protein
MNLQELAQKKADLERRKERLLGKLEAATANLAQLDQRLRGKGIDPDRLKEEIERLTSERNRMVEELKVALNEADEVISRIESRIENL